MAESKQDVFTERELQVIQLLLMAESTKFMASQLHISTRTVEFHLSHIYEKLHVYTRTGAVIKLIDLFKK